MKKVLLLFILAVTSVFAEITTELSSYKIVRNSEGKIEKVSAEQASPGDIVSYEFYIKNGSEEIIYNLNPIIPIPEGTTLIPDTITPKKGYKVSSNGRDFVEYPIKIDNVEISTGEYRGVSWEISQLDKEMEVTLELQVRINTPN
nr:hypothetical protein [uncultured Cetobacterium sp.]